MKQRAVENSLVLDIGKTNVKLHLIAADGQPLQSATRANTVLHASPYPHADVEGIWQWILEQVPAFLANHDIHTISITTHGATAALINSVASALVMPVLDYEYTGIDGFDAQYHDLAPRFEESFSPPLPAGLNLGRQIFWQSQAFPEKFAQVTHVLMYPQYWAWRFCGELCNEVTSLGCHTDLWCPERNTYSSLVTNAGWAPLFPALKFAGQALGNVLPAVAKATGLSPSVKVFAGVHDSNASFLRYKLEKEGLPFTVISTGTWTILMASGADTKCLSPQKDMLANVDVEAKPVACARFMGGREFEAICAEFGGRLGDDFTVALLQKMVSQNIMALPDFSGGSGPFGGRSSECININDDLVQTPGFGAALASLYCAMMMDYQLDMLQVSGDIFIEGAFLQNPLLCGLLAALRADQQTYLSADATGTVQGCASLTRWQGPHKSIDLTPSEKVSLEGLQSYRDAWRAHAEAT